MDAENMHDLYSARPRAGIPDFGIKEYKRIPSEIYTHMKNVIPPEQWKRERATIWYGIGRPKFPHPSLRRQINLATKILDKIYTCMLTKIDSKKIRRTLIQDSFPVIIFLF